MEREALETLADESMGAELTIKELAEKDDITVEDLRSLLGDTVRDTSDEDLLAQWNASAEEEAEEKEGEEGKPTDEPPAWVHPYRFVGEDGKDFDVSKIPADLLKAKLKYTADGKDEVRSLGDAIRLLQRRPLEEREAQALRDTTSRAFAEINSLREAASKHAEAANVWAWVLQDPTGAHFLKVLEAHQAQGPTSQFAAQEGPSADDIAAEGERVYQTEYLPVLQEFARSYSLDGNTPSPDVVQHLDKEIDKLFRETIAMESANLVADPQGYGAARLRRLLDFDIPSALESVGYRRVGSTAPAPPAASAEVAKLRAELKNAQTELAKARVKGAPTSGAGSAAGAGAGGSGVLGGKTFTSWEDMKDAIDGRE